MRKILLSLFILLGSLEVPLQLYNAVATHVQDEFSIVASDSQVSSPDGSVRHHVEHNERSTSFGFINSASAQTYLDFLVAGDLPPPVEVEHFVFIGGQSNAVGLATNPAAFSLTGVIPNALIHDNGFGGVYEPLEFGVNNEGLTLTQFGPELSLGKYLGNAVGRDIYIGKYAIAGAALADVPGGNDFAVGSSQYNTLVGNINNAYANLPVSVNPYQKTFVWVQGERDGQGETGQPLIYSSVYDTNWDNFITNLEDDIGFTFDMIVICRISENQRLGYITTVTGFDQVVTMQNTIVSTGGSRYKIVNTDNFNTNPTDKQHYHGSGQNDLGVDVAKTILGETIPAIPHDDTWTPAQYTGLVELWLDGKQGVTLTSGEVSQWDDQSGNARHFTQSNAALRPTYNGTDAIVFNLDAILDGTAWVNSFNTLTQGEIIVVYERTNTLTPTDWIVSLGNSSNDNFFYSVFIRPSASSNPDRVWSYKSNGAGAGSQLYNTTVIPATTSIFKVSNNSYGFYTWQNSQHEEQLASSFGNIGETGYLSNFSTALNTFSVGGLRRTTNLLSKVNVKCVIVMNQQTKYEQWQSILTWATNYYGL